jgi:hypothetical protein
MTVAARVQSSMLTDNKLSKIHLLTCTTHASTLISTAPANMPSDTNRPVMYI